ncbi:MAG: trypsin-like peptidase domain-containing protein [Planctomycetota bacterium]
MIRSFARILPLVLFLAIGVSAQTPTRADLGELESRVRTLVDRVAPATVGLQIGTDGPAGASAVIVSADGWVLTAAHCIPEVGGKMTVLLPDGRRLAATALGKNDRLDIGLVRIDEKGDWPWVPMGLSSALEIDEAVVAIGHPSGFDLARGPLVRLGWILARSAPHGAFLQTTAKVRPGDSGGPLFDLDGRVVGIHSNINTSLDGNFHVPVDLFRENWDRMAAKEHWGKGGIGAREDPWKGKPYAGLEAENLDEGGLLVKRVRRMASAARAGIKPGDVIIDVDGTRVPTWRQLGRWLRSERRIGDSVVFGVLREGKRLEFELTLLPKPGHEEKPPPGPAKASSQAPPASAAEGPRFTRDFEELAAVFDKAQDGWRRAVVRIESRFDEETREILGTVVDAGKGLVLTKASEIGAEPVAHTWSGGRGEAVLGASDLRADLALLRIEAEDLTAVDFEASPALKPGAFAVTAGSRARIVGVGVVAVAEREIDPIRVAVLGVFLGASSEEAPGVLVERISDGGAAATAGLLAGDRIVTIGEVTLGGPQDLHDFLRAHLPGEKAKVGVRRGEESLEFEVTFGDRPDLDMNGDEPPVPGGLSGRRGRFASAFRYDAPLRPRDCGAPVFDLQGRLVGLAIARASRTHAHVLPASLVARVLADLRR